MIIYFFKKEFTLFYREKNMTEVENYQEAPEQYSDSDIQGYIRQKESEIQGQLSK